MENVNAEYIEVILKHLRKEASPFEEQLLREWLEDSPEHKTFFEQTKRTWERSGKAYDDFRPDTEAAWQKVKKMANLDLPQAADEEGGRVIKLHPYRTILRVAAAAVFVIAVALVSVRLLFPQPDTISYKASGKKEMFYLPDSSKVWLNRNSEISFAENFEGDYRELRLKGEAFFEVRKNRNKPFRVWGRESLTEVLGTSFVVKVQEGQPESVEVITGKVSFAPSRRTSAKVILTPGFAARIEGGSAVASKADNPNSLAWNKEKLVFDDARLGEVAEAIEQYFGTKLVIADKKLKNCRFTGTFDKPAEKEVMEVLSASVGFTFQKTDSAYVLKGEGCQ